MPLDATNGQTIHALIQVTDNGAPPFHELSARIVTVETRDSIVVVRFRLRHISDSGIVRELIPGGWMRPTRLLCTIGVSLCLTGVAGNQAAPTTPLPEALRAHVKDERFGIVTSIRGLPLGVRDELQTLFGSQTLDIAEPGAEFQATDDVANPKLPSRRLIAAGCARDNHCLVYYERGGRNRTWRVMLFHWTPTVTRFEWGGTAPRGLTTIDDVRNAVLSGIIKSGDGVW